MQQIPKPLRQRVLLVSDGCHIPTWHEYVETVSSRRGYMFMFKCTETNTIRQYGYEKVGGAKVEDDTFD